MIYGFSWEWSDTLTSYQSLALVKFRAEKRRTRGEKGRNDLVQQICLLSCHQQRIFHRYFLPIVLTYCSCKWRRVNERFVLLRFRRLPNVLHRGSFRLPAFINIKTQQSPQRKLLGFFITHFSWFIILFPDSLSLLQMGYCCNVSQNKLKVHTDLFLKKNKTNDIITHVFVQCFKLL